MPGLVGIVWNKTVDEPLLDNMANSIKHEEWHRLDKYADSFFGGARVSLGTFNPEPQPIFNEDGTICIFMYGKIYDYEGQANELRNRGHQFTVDNDADFCLHSYEEYGKHFVNSLNGSFVLAIYDLKRRKVVIANDRYGLRPLYYTTSSGKLVFASEVKAILEDGAFNKELNDEAIADFFAFGEIMGNKTFFRGIETLPPASVMTYDEGNVSLEQYWDFNYEPDYSISEDEFVEQLVVTLTKAVEVQMRDNLRYGVALSGGLDSRVILAAINKSQRHRVMAFSFGTPGCYELKIAQKVAKKAGVNQMVIELAPDELVSYAEKVVYLSDGMGVISVSFIPYAFARASEQVDIFFFGTGVCPVINGAFLNQGVLKAKSTEELVQFWYRDLALFSPQAMAALFANDYYANIKDMPLNSLIEALHRAKPEHPGNKSDYFFLRNHIRRATFLGSVIIRNKMEEALAGWDNELIELGLRIPPELRNGRHIYRKFLMRLGPELATIPYSNTMVRVDAPLRVWSVGVAYQSQKERIKKQIWRLTKGKIYLSNKRHFANFDEWLRLNEKWGGLVKGLLLDDKARSKGYFNKEYIETLIREHEVGKANHSSKLDYLATFELFLRMFVDS
jgi:asparagine synthase (glutamine-hydrolysing)